VCPGCECLYGESVVVCVVSELGDEEVFGFNEVCVSVE